MLNIIARLKKPRGQVVAGLRWFGAAVLVGIIVGLVTQLLLPGDGLSSRRTVLGVPGTYGALHDAYSVAAGYAVPILVAALLLLLGLVMSDRRQLSGRARMITDANEALRQTDQLFAMTETLQSADGYQDAIAVLMATSRKLLPQLGGALYIFNHSRDRLDLSGSWQLPAGYTPAEILSPDNCWALKRGKRHVNNPDQITLCCAHAATDHGTLEIPMMARGKVYGLLFFVTGADENLSALLDHPRLGQALADSMSLALANITLREELRTQALRDPLTGLYNRRYMTDALDRYVNLAERVGGTTAVLMIDLDDFKRLNDDHGHAMGDAVLRDVAGQLIGGLRSADIVCRYGGEELLVIMPDCTLADAFQRAQLLRARIEGLSQTHGATISASFGVAAIPETSTSTADLVPMADAALYRAKRAGKNRVAAAERRGAAEPIPSSFVEPELPLEPTLQTAPEPAPALAPQLADLLAD